MCNLKQSERIKMAFTLDFGIYQIINPEPYCVRREKSYIKLFDTLSFQGKACMPMLLLFTM